MIHNSQRHGAYRSRTLCLGLLSATALTVAALSPTAAFAAQFGVVVNQIPDPILTNLNIPATAPTQGMWSGVMSWPLNAILMSVLPTGKIATFGSPIGNPGVQNGRTFDIWDPYQGAVDSGHVNFQEPGFINSFCSAMTFQADGSLLVTGGIFDSGVDKGSAVLNPAANGVGALAAKVANDRYYSTMITLASGRPLIMGGSYPYQGGWSDPQGSIDRGYMTGMTPETYDGANWNSLFGANSRDAFGPDNNHWWYSRAWVAPSGKVFGISSDKMWLLDPNGNGSVTSMPFKEPQRNASSATDAPNVGPTSTAVMYDAGKILQVGGNSYDNFNGNLASSRATLVDINGANPVVTDTAPTRFGRSWAQSTVLPTGQVIVSLGAAVAAPPQTATPVIVATAGTGTGSGAGAGTGGTGGTTAGGTGTGTGTGGTGGAGTAPAGTTTLKAVHSGMCLSVAGANGNDGAPVTQQVCTGGAEQSWKMTAVNGGYTIANAATGKCLDVAYVSKAVGGQVWQWSCNGQANQIWASKPQANGNAYVSLNSNLCLDVAYVSMAAGGQVWQWSCLGSPNQTFISTATSGTAGSTTGAGGVAPVPTTNVSLESASAPGTYARRMYGDMMAAASMVSAVDRMEATFKIVTGLGGQGVSFQSTRETNRYIQHANFTMYLPTIDNIALKGDASFMRRAPLAQSCGCNSGSCVSYESVTWPGYYIRNRTTGI